MARTWKDRYRKRSRWERKAGRREARRLLPVLLAYLFEEAA